jgi:hypothetical protein
VLRLRVFLAIASRTIRLTSGCRCRLSPTFAATASILHHGDSHWLYLLGRVHRGTNTTALQSKIGVALRQWLYTRPIPTANGGAAIVPKMHVVLTARRRRHSEHAAGDGQGPEDADDSSSVVLLIACANIANLAAGAQHRRGARTLRCAWPWARAQRVTRQILTESVLLSCMGGLAGLVVAFAGSHSILALAFPMRAICLSMPARP